MITHIAAFMASGCVGMMIMAICSMSGLRAYEESVRMYYIREKKRRERHA